MSSLHTSEISKKIETSNRYVKNQTGHICKEMTALEKELLAIIADNEIGDTAATAILKAIDAAQGAIADAVALVDAEAEDVTSELSELIDRLINELAEVKTEFSEYKGADEGWAKIKIGSVAHRDKLEAFVTSEIWPNYNEQSNYSI